MKALLRRGFRRFSGRFTGPGLPILPIRLPIHVVRHSARSSARVADGGTAHLARGHGCVRLAGALETRRMQGSIRQRSAGSFELRVFVGVDPETRRKRYRSVTFRGKRAEVERELNPFLV
jgi:hypothetical protein